MRYTYSLCTSDSLSKVPQELPKRRQVVRVSFSEDELSDVKSTALSKHCSDMFTTARATNIFTQVPRLVSLLVACE